MPARERCGPRLLALAHGWPGLGTLVATDVVEPVIEISLDRTAVRLVKAELLPGGPPHGGFSLIRLVGLPLYVLPARARQTASAIDRLLG